jgi:hypothetical protein
MAGIYFAFSNKNTTKRSLSVRHTKEKIEKMRTHWDSTKYESYTRENFIILCLYINFTKSPSSCTSAFTKLAETSLDEAIKFKNAIINYKIELIKDIEFLQNLYGNSIDLRTITHHYRKNDIKWFTYYFYVKVSNSTEKVKTSRIDKNLYSKITTLLLYVTFSERSYKIIDKILKDNIKI